MLLTFVVRGRFSGGTFIPDDPLPDAEGPAELIITPKSVHLQGSIVEAFGTAAVLRSGDDILAQVCRERDEWADR